MAAIDDVKAHLAELDADVAAVSAKVAELKATQVVGVPEVDVQAVADKLATVHAALVAAVQ